MNWYAKTINKDSAHEQGLVIDENTGANICITLDANDARLIAAAPELLAALEAAVIALQDFQKEGFPVGVLLRDARAAIAKAKGE